MRICLARLFVFDGVDDTQELLRDRKFIQKAGMKSVEAIARHKVRVATMVEKRNVSVVSVSI